MYKRKGNQDAIDFLLTVSPVASQHLNIGGLYEFTEEISDINIDKMVALMEQILDETLRSQGPAEPVVPS